MKTPNGTGTAPMAHPMAAAAAVDAQTAARGAAVEITAVSDVDELDQLRTVMETIWGPEIVPPRNLLRGLALGGAGLLVARDGGGPVGFALGWLGWEAGIHFHSHQTGVVAAGRGTGIGRALKLTQRSQCLANGITEMRWTFDPLLAANASFNLVRLGARVTGFHPDCYGRRTDAFNTGDVTDRLEVSWRLDATVGGQPVDLAEPARRLIRIDPDGTANRSAEVLSGGAVIDIPRQYTSLRDADRRVGASWRAAVGDLMSELFATGMTIAGWDRRGYVIGPAGSVDASDGGLACD